MLAPCQHGANNVSVYCMCHVVIYRYYYRYKVHRPIRPVTRDVLTAGCISGVICCIRGYIRGYIRGLDIVIQKSGTLPKCVFLGLYAASGDISGVWRL